MWQKLFSRKKCARAKRVRLAVEPLEDRRMMAVFSQVLERGLAGMGVLESPAWSPHNPSEICVNTDMGQAFCSNDLGNSWDFTNQASLQVSNKVNGVQYTSDPKTLFAIDTSTGFPAPTRSVDGGLTWQKTGTNGFLGVSAGRAAGRAACRERELAE